MSSVRPVSPAFASATQRPAAGWSPTHVRRALSNAGAEVTRWTGALHPATTHVSPGCAQPAPSVASWASGPARYTGVPAVSPVAAAAVVLSPAVGSPSSIRGGSRSEGNAGLAQQVDGWGQRVHVEQTGFAERGGRLGERPGKLGDGPRSERCDGRHALRGGWALRPPPAELGRRREHGRQVARAGVHLLAKTFVDGRALEDGACVPVRSDVDRNSVGAEQRKAASLRRHADGGNLARADLRGCATRPPGRRVSLPAAARG